MRISSHSHLRWLTSLWSALLVGTWLLTTTPVFAAGSVRPNKNQLQEASGRWKIMMTITLPRAPPTPFMTLRFSFQPKVIYETFLDDSSPNEKNRDIKQEKDVAPKVESMEVGFGDTGTGKIYNVTKFDFNIRRDHDFMAGEYEVKVIDSNDRVIGSPFRLTLKGKNDVIDRRTIKMVENDRKKAKKTDDAKKDDGEKKEGDAPPPTDTPSDPTIPDEKPAGTQVKPKQGGCGCYLPANTSHQPTAVLVLGLGAAAVAVRRRSRKRNSLKPLVLLPISPWLVFHEFVYRCLTRV
jgi:hypothetical protein